MLLPLLLQAATVVPPSTTPVAKDSLRSAIGMILRGEGASARSTLQSIPPSALNATDGEFRRCAVSRLTDTPSPGYVSDAPTSDMFLQKLLALYQSYWRRSAIDEKARPKAEKVLIAGLGRLLGQRVTSVSDAEPIFAARLKAAGYFSQAGRTGVLRDLMVWSRDTHKVESVDLPEGAVSTQVNYLDGFVSRGWSSYFTCNRTGTGGWATGDGLFVIVPGYASLTDETFKVNFLAHESQHFADKTRFDDLQPWRLEYRAKLVELAYADTTMGHVLDTFSSNQSDNPSDPHSYANKRAVQAMQGELKVTSFAELRATPVDRLHAAAIAILKADSAALVAERQGQGKH